MRIIDELKRDETARQQVVAWVASMNANALIHDWYYHNWGRYHDEDEDSEPRDLPFDVAKISLPSGYGWCIVASSNLSIDLKYYRFDDSEHVIRFEFCRSGGRFCCLRVYEDGKKIYYA